MSREFQENLTRAMILETEKATDAIKEKWLYFQKVFSFKDTVPLSEVVETFSIPIREYIEKSHPLLAEGPTASDTARHFWLMIFTAILQSGTHPTDDVNQTFAEISDKYGS